MAERRSKANNKTMETIKGKSPKGRKYRRRDWR